MKKNVIESPTINQNQAFLEIVYLFIVPVVLIYVGVIPHSWRLLVLLCVVLLISSIIKYQHWTRAQLGIASPFKYKAVLAWMIFSVISTVLIIFYAQAFGFEPLALFDWSASWQLILFFIPISVLQEVAYRAFLTERLREFSFSMRHRVILNASLFALLHIIYPYAVITLPIAFFGGVLFAWLYEKYPDFIMACIAHSILNFTAVLFGIFS